MRQKKENLTDLLDNINYYTNIVNLGNPPLSILTRYYLSNWQFYKRKKENAKTEKRKIKYGGKAQVFWNNYNALFPAPHTNQNS